MKPLRLEFQAFGSYPNKEVVDFTVLARRGLFVVTGPTGTGKSTIFDAMVYALYGKLPGSRAGDDVDCRSQHAPVSTETYVQFDFEVDGVVYRVLRRPSQERAAKRGGGTTKQNAEASLAKLVGGTVEPIATKVMPVTAEVEALVGLDASQFQRVVLLPQGAFTAFLLAKEDEREKLLRPLFGGEVYQRATEWLKGEAKRLNDIVGASDEKIRHHQHNAAASLAQVLQAWLDTEVPVDELVDAGDASMLERVEALAAEDTRRRALMDQQEAAAKAAGEVAATAEAAAKLFDGVAEARRRQAQLEGERDDIEATRARAEASVRARPVVAAATRVAAASGAVVNAQAELDAFLALVSRSFGELGRPVPDASAQAVSTAVAKAGQELRADDALLKAAGIAQQVSTDAERTVERERVAVATAADVFGASERTVEEQHARVTSLEPIAAAAPQRKVDMEAAQRAVTDRDKLDKARKKLEKAQASEVGAKAAYELLMARFVATQAPRLAEQLQQGEPCSVCGSVEHPAPAQFIDGDQVDHDEVDAARARWSADQGAVAAAGQEATQLIESLGDAASDDPAVLKTRHADAAAAYAEATQAEQSLSSLRASLDDAKVKLKELEQAVSACSTALAVAEADAVSKRAALQSAQEASAHINPTALGVRLAAVDGLEIALASVDTVFSGVTSAQAALDTEQSALATALAASGYASGDAAAAACLDAKDEVVLQQRVAGWDSALTGVAAELAALEGQGVPAERPEAEVLRKAANDQADEAKVAASAFTTARDALRAARESLESARKVGEDSARDRAARDVARRVHATCNGDAGIRVKLERWVLARELERVTLAANVHLGRMSNGRYQLHRDATKGGLRLEVLDAHTGKRRPTNSLSGGEQFQASLSLALGLADVVSHGGSASGKQFEALFVDEGFGSLDQEALTQAIDALEQIHASGRMVGAITHVEEMKQRLHRGIEVSRLPNDSGSTLRVNP